MTAQHTARRRSRIDELTDEFSKDLCAHVDFTAQRDDYERAIWRGHPILAYAYSDFQSFKENYRISTGEAANAYASWMRSHKADAATLCALALQRLRRSTFPQSDSSIPITVAQRHGDRLTLWLYGPVEPIASSLLEALREHPDASGITLRVDCPGGLTGKAFQLAGALMRHRAKKLAIVDRACWSAAVPIAVACNRVLIRENAQLMVHPPTTSCVGDSAAMIAAAETLRRTAAAYMHCILRRRKRVMDGRILRQLCSRQSFLSADEAVKFGFADRVIHALPTVALAAPPPAGDPVKLSPEA